MADFTNLYDEYVDRLFAFGTRFTTDREMLKDCIQDVFVKYYTRQKNLAPIENIDSYLFMSLRNRICDEYRRNVRMSDNEINDSNMGVLTENDAYSYEHMEHQQLINDSVARFISMLPPRQRQIMNLYYLEERKYDDICRIMGINYQSVRNLMHRSISRLREYAGQMLTAV